MQALRIEFDLWSGKRSGDINPHDRGLPCYGWQDLESVPAWEIRLIDDDRDVSQYEGIKGITILHNEAEIQAEIDKLPVQYSVNEPNLFQAHINQKGKSALNLDTLPGTTIQKQLAYLYEQGIKGILRRQRDPITKYRKV